MFHPGLDLTKAIQKKGRTQKEFSTFCDKKPSEINELIKGKRKFTIQWDLILHKVLNTPQKFWINKQMAYDYEIAKQTFDDSNIIVPKENSHHEVFKNF